MSNDDIIAGWQLSVTMQRRTPLAWLLRHGEFHEGSDRPTRWTNTRDDNGLWRQWSLKLARYLSMAGIFCRSW